MTTMTMNWWLKAKRDRLLNAIGLLAGFRAVLAMCKLSEKEDFVKCFDQAIRCRPVRLRHHRAESRALTCIYGIRCTIKNWWLRDVIYVVLGQVRDRDPDNFARLRRRVTTFAPMPLRIKDAWGQWIEKRGTILLSDWAYDPIALVAHELGHACTTPEDLEKRRVAGVELAEELSADAYAIKWGFGWLIELSRKHRDAKHHGPAPGSIVCLNGRRYRLTKQLHFRHVREGVR